MKRILGVAMAGVLALSLAGVVPAAAKEGDVIATGACSRNAEWKLKLSPEDGQLEVEFEVDSNVNRQRWSVAISQNGTQIFSGNRVTRGPSGSFTVRLLAPDAAGTDAFTASATNAATGETCSGAASI
jgi:hypothetical protein